MKWKNVKLIFFREARDQLRDRRTFFTVAVLPVLLYPLLGTVFLQIAQFMREHPVRIRVIGTASLPDSPKLIDDEAGGFSREFCPEDEAKLLNIKLHKKLPENYTSANLIESVEAEIQAGTFDAIVYFPDQFGESLAKSRTEMPNAPPDPDAVAPESVAPEIFSNTANDKSRIARERVDRVLRRWREQMVQQHLAQKNIPVAATTPFSVANTDVAREQTRRAAFWSKILPLVVMIWALTGAFYPAIDLCAGEKERGTLETLLSCPALRAEIVCGKLLTVMSFSMATSLLNLASMGFTGLFIVRQMQQLAGAAPTLIGSPPPLALLWLVLALIPISALFSALALAIAAFARSTKEGQYYLMPLLLVTFPLMTLPLMPTAQLDLGSALIPVSGMMLLVRSLIEAQYWDAIRFAGPVVGVTALCCVLSIRWAVDQFNNESVLFRESEQWGVGLWLRQLVRDRADTPTFAEALLCGVVLLMIQFFANMTARTPGRLTPESLTFIVLVSQFALIATPALLMTIMLTTSLRRTLSLYTPRPLAIPAAILLALCLHPTVLWAGKGIERLYPLSEQTVAAVKPLMEMLHQMPIWQVVLLIALTPAICEELAFRGFILSGLRHSGHKWLAIILSSLFFGVTHGILQQSIAACGVGIIIGYLCVQSGSLLPGICFHFTHNSLAVLSSRLTRHSAFTEHPDLRWLLSGSGDDLIYSVPVTLLSAFLAGCLVYWFRKLPYQAYEEEVLQDALDHQPLNEVGGVKCGL